MDDYSDFFKIASFQTRLNEMKWNRDLIEFKHNTFINASKLEEMSVTKEDLEKYGQECARLANGEYYNLQYLKNQVLESKLCDLDFDDLFYENVMRYTKGVKSIRFDGVLICRCADEPLSKAKFIEYIISKYKKISSYNLLSLLKDEYKVETELCKIKEIISNTSLYYNEIMDTFYENYQLFIEEI